MTGIAKPEESRDGSLQSPLNDSDVPSVAFTVVYPSPLQTGHSTVFVSFSAILIVPFSSSPVFPLTF